ncbi:MAG TPA: carboxypeptidase-like regulatory domain-containing protein [Candidatus Thermoplasmatota archaeon]|nr:carboxypeptidase-like regulatory domain-containing protein [Candidatus Thermoplasmatota archaeon]
MRVLVIVALLAGALLAGCSGSQNDPDPASAPEPTFDDLGLQATDSTGVIRGVVVDDAIRPVAGAKVSMKGEMSKEAVSTDIGTFGFDGLPAGTYFLTVSKPGYFEAQQSAEVIAGVAEPAITEVQLVVDAANRPYVETYVFEGYIECSGTFVAVSFAACSAVNLVSNEAGLGNATEDNFGTFYPLTRKPTWMQSEMIWDSTQALGGKMALMYSWDCGDENGGFLCDHQVAGKSPLLLTADAAAIDEINEGDYTQDLFVRAFNEGLDETQPGVGGGLGVTLEQRFSVYTHVFYGYEPTMDWRFSSGEPVPGPEA